MCRTSIIGKLVTNPAIKYDSSNILFVSFTLKATEYFQKKSIINSYQIIVYGIEPKSISSKAIKGTKIMVIGSIIPPNKYQNISTVTEKMIMTNPGFIRIIN